MSLAIEIQYSIGAKNLNELSDALGISVHIILIYDYELLKPCHDRLDDITCARNTQN